MVDLIFSNSWGVLATLFLSRIRPDIEFIRIDAQHHEFHIINRTSFVIKDIIIEGVNNRNFIFDKILHYADRKKGYGGRYSGFDLISGLAKKEARVLSIKSLCWLRQSSIIDLKIRFKIPILLFLYIPIKLKYTVKIGFKPPHKRRGSEY